MYDLTVLSLGAGVQSSVMALLAERGEIERPDFAVFADTQWEPAAIYGHLDWLERQLTFPVHRVTAGNIREDQLKSVAGGRFASIPYYTGGDSEGQVRRQCTREYKIDPIVRHIRSVLGLKRYENSKFKVSLQMGISIDEAVRMKPNRIPWIENTWPLVDLGMSRSNCHAWFDREYPNRTLQKSACIGCPYKSNDQWRFLKRNSPKEWADVIDFDEKIRSNTKYDSDLYLHRSRAPLSEADIGDDNQLDMFGEECEGMCGV